MQSARFLYYNVHIRRDRINVVRLCLFCAKAGEIQMQFVGAGLCSIRQDGQMQICAAQCKGR